MNLPETTTATFQHEVLESDLPVLVDVGAPWCPPCKLIEPFVDTLAQRYSGRLNVFKLDADTNPDLQTRYGVMGLPTLLLFRGGQLVRRIVGYQPLEKLDAQIQPYL